MENKNIAFVIGFNDSQVIVKCPYCKQKHYHGKAGQKITDTNFGTRVPHCTDKQRLDAGISKTDNLPEYEIQSRVMLHEFI